MRVVSTIFPAWFMFLSLPIPSAVGSGTPGGGTGKHPGIAAPHIFVSGIAGQGQPLSGSWLLQPPCKGCFPGRRHHSGAYLDLAPVVLPACIRGERGRLESLLPTP